MNYNNDNNNNNNTTDASRTPYPSDSKPRTSSYNDVNPLQRILSASQNIEAINKKAPKTAALFNDTKYALFQPKNEKEMRPMTADVFRSNGDSKTDKKLSSKIIKELVNFVEGERHNRSSAGIEKVQLFPLANSSASQSVKSKLTNIPGKDAQILTIED